MQEIIQFHEGRMRQNYKKRESFFRDWSYSTWGNFVEKYEETFLPEKNRLKNERYRIEEEFKEDIDKFSMSLKSMTSEEVNRIYITYIKPFSYLKYNRNSKYEGMFSNVDDYIRKPTVVEDQQQTVAAYLEKIKATNSPLNRRR